jgi:hypothetical protein
MKKWKKSVKLEGESMKVQDEKNINNSDIKEDIYSFNRRSKSPGGTTRMPEEILNHIKLI